MSLSGFSRVERRSSDTEHAALKAEGGIDDVDLEEVLQQVVFRDRAHVVDRLPDVPEHGRSDEGALHQAAGGLVVERQRAFDGGAVCGGDLVEDARPAVFFEVAEQEGRVVRIEVADHRRDGGVGQFVQRLEAGGVG